MNDEKIGALVEAVYRANFHTIGVFALDAIFDNNKCHDIASVLFSQQAINFARRF